MQQARSTRSVLAVSMKHEAACKTAPYIVDTEVIQGSSYFYLLLCLESVDHSRKWIVVNDIFESRYRLDTSRSSNNIMKDELRGTKPHTRVKEGIRKLFPLPESIEGSEVSTSSL